MVDLVPLDNFRDFFVEPLETVLKATSGVSSIDLFILFEFRTNERRDVNDENEDFVVEIWVLGVRSVETET
jgi:hypothetical protein